MEEENYPVEVIDDYKINFDYSFKIILIGDSNVGKSCLSLRGIKDVFESFYSQTIGFEFIQFNIKVDGKIIKLQIWDTCGQEEYRSLISSFYKTASLAIIVYSIDNKESFNNLEFWLKDLRNNANPDIIIFVIGNKCDLEDKRQITKDMAREFCENNEIKFFLETSAKTGFNAQKIFIEASKFLYKQYNEFKRRISRSNLFFMAGLMEEKTKEEPKKEDLKEPQEEEGKKEDFEENPKEEPNIEIKAEEFKDKKEGKKEEEEEEEGEKENEREITDKNCSLEEHKDIEAIIYCQECKINMCENCEKVHSGLLKNHHIYPLNKDINQIFTGFCTKKSHSLKLQFYCKTHNQLCCAACISKIRIKGNGQHKDCEVYYITKIKADKKEILEKNMKNIEELSNKLEANINELKNI